MKNIYLVLAVALFLASCKDDNSVSQQDAGLDAAVRNFPVGYIYVEYPTFSDGSNNIDPSNPCNMGYFYEGNWVYQSMNGSWDTINEYNGRFFRAEDGRAEPFFGDVGLDGGRAPSATQTMQNDALQAHRHGVGAIKNDKTYNDGGYPAPLIGIDETSYGNAGGRTLEHNVANSKNLIDNFTNPTTGETNSTALIDVETRPENYTMRMWIKTLDSYTADSCAVLQNVQVIEYKDINKITKDREGNVLNTETIKRVVGRKAVYDANGNAEYRIIGGHNIDNMKPRDGVVITNSPDIEINVGKEEVVETK